MILSVVVFVDFTSAWTILHIITCTHVFYGRMLILRTYKIQFISYHHAPFCWFDNVSMPNSYFNTKVQIANYDGILLPLTCKINYVNIQHSYVDMQLIFVNICKMIYWHATLFKSHVNIIIWHVDIFMLHVDIIYMYLTCRGQKCATK